MIQIYLKSIHCHEETDEVGADEPYVLVTSVNVAANLTVAPGLSVPLPAFDVVLYGPFEDMDEGETHGAPGASLSFWGVTGAPAPLTDPANAIFIVSLMENDDGRPNGTRGIMKGIVGGSILGSLSFNRQDKVAALFRDINSAMLVPTGGPNFDDIIGIQELQFSADELRRAEAGETVSKRLEIDGDGGRYELMFEASNRGWKGPVAFGDARLFPGAPVSIFQQTPGVWTGLTVGLTVDKDGRQERGDNGAMNFVWADFNISNPPWRGPVAFGDAHLFPGALVSIFQQTPGVWTGLTVDKNGAMNFVWADFNISNPPWQGPNAFGDAHLFPGAPVSIFQQTPGVWTGLTVDKNGAMNFVWADFNISNPPWQGPNAFGDAHLFPGAPVSIFQQTPGVWTGLTVDKNGAMNFVWADFNISNPPWQGPNAFGDAHLFPGAPVSIFQQTPGVWTGLTVDKNGAMNFVWSDFNISNPPWQGPNAFGDAHLFPGAPVSIFQQTPGVWTGLTVDKNGAMNFVWSDFNISNPPWQGPVAFGDAHLFPGAPVSIFQQTPGVWAGLTVDKSGAMNVVWADFNTNSPSWQGPVAFGDAHLFPGAPVSIFQQTPGVWAGLTVDKNGAMNVVWADFN